MALGVPEASVTPGGNEPALTLQVKGPVRRPQSRNGRTPRRSGRSAGCAVVVIVSGSVRTIWSARVTVCEAVSVTLAVTE